MMIYCTTLSLLLTNGCSDGEEIQAAKGMADGYFEVMCILKLYFFCVVKKQKDKSAEDYFEIHTPKIIFGPSVVAINTKSYS